MEDKTSAEAATFKEQFLVVARDMLFEQIFRVPVIDELELVERAARRNPSLTHASLEGVLDSEGASLEDLLLSWLLDPNQTRTEELNTGEKYSEHFDDVKDSRLTPFEVIRTEPARAARSLAPSEQFDVYLWLASQARTSPGISERLRDQDQVIMDAWRRGNFGFHMAQADFAFRAPFDSDEVEAIFLALLRGFALAARGGDEEFSSRLELAVLSLFSVFSQDLRDDGDDHSIDEMAQVVSDTIVRRLSATDE